MDVAGVTDVADVTDVTDITDVMDVTDITDVTNITGGTVRHMASHGGRACTKRFWRCFLVC